ncbi:MAG: hypothetical protein K9G60_08520 [Pseudolabrys sp.]|nr:hypothetical protein [Pseudolabrys sp.]
MTGSDDTTKKPAKPTKTGGRDARLAAALRENLRRRKAQERERARGRASPNEPAGRPESGANPTRDPPGSENG